MQSNLLLKVAYSEMVVATTVEFRQITLILTFFTAHRREQMRSYFHLLSYM